MILYATKEFALNRGASRSIRVGLEVKNFLAIPLLFFYGDKGGIIFNRHTWDCLKDKQGILLDYLDGDLDKLESIKIGSGPNITKIFGTKADSPIIGFRQTNSDTKQSQCVVTGKVTMENLFNLVPVIDKYLTALFMSQDEINHALANLYQKNKTIPEDKKITSGGINLQFLFTELSVTSDVAETQTF